MVDVTAANLPNKFHVVNGLETNRTENINAGRLK